MDICIVRRLEVVGKDTIMVPGCEPTSALTSDTLSRFMDCKRCYVSLVDALDAIPGSSVEYQVNNGESNGGTKKWFVLPQQCIECPCEDTVDYYRILKDLTKVDINTQEELDCGVIDNIDRCCEFNNDREYTPNPYKKEGSYLSVRTLLNSPLNWSQHKSGNLDR